MTRSDTECGTSSIQGNLQDIQRPVILLATRTFEPSVLESDPDIKRLAKRFDFLLASSPARALTLARIIHSAGGRILLLLSDMLSSGSDVTTFISVFNRHWPEAALHLFDALEGRVIFTEPQDPALDGSPSIQIEPNGHEPLDPRLVTMMVERYFPEDN